MPVTVLAYNPDRISFSGTTHGPCYLVVANNYDPRWKATVNGKETDVIQANNTFQAVYIPEAGEFKAVLTFESPIVWWIHIATILGLILIIAVAFLSSHAQKSTPHSATMESGSPHRLPALAGGAVATVLWFTGYYLFIFLKGKGAIAPMEYIMVVTPIMGMLISLMAEKITRRD